MNLLEYNINTGFNNKDKPYVLVEISYKDYFTDDKYLLKGISQNSNVNDIDFVIFRNNDNIGNLKLQDKNNDKFLREFFEMTNDFDFKESFKKKHSKKLSEEISNFLNKCDSSIILNGNILEGYKDKMKRMAGISDEKVIYEGEVKYFLNSPEKGYNVYYFVTTKDDSNMSKLGFSSYDLGQNNIEKKLLLNKTPFKQKNAAVQFATYKAKEYSVFFDKNNWRDSNFIPSLNDTTDFIQVRFDD
jgi:hypothetical protein